jgi:hypothetical protein
LFIFAVWPYWVGTYVAVQCGAANPSTQRSVIGWIFEVAWLIALAESVIRKYVKHRQAEKELALALSPLNITKARSGNSTVYRHGQCPVNHRSPHTAVNCRNP